LAGNTIHAAEFAGGTGTSADPYQIATAEQLISIGSDPNLLSKHFVMINDIDLDPNISPAYVLDGAAIGSVPTSFSGVFDGNGFRICHLTIDSGEYWTGLFGSVGDGGEIKRLTLDTVSISGRASLGTTGALCATSSGVVRQCSVSGLVLGSDVAGGLVGWNNGIIEECRSICSVTATWSGGLTGVNKGRLQDCYASGRVSGEWYAGGLAGLIAGWVNCSYATCQVDGINAGGLIGGHYRLGSVITDSYFLSSASGGGPDNGFGIPLTSKQMKQVNSFAGWQFWGMGNDGFRISWFMPEDSYPELAWFSLVALPKISGSLIEEAYEVMEEAHVDVCDVVCDYDHAVEWGHVIMARPDPKASPGTAVDIVVSLGPYDWSSNPGTGEPNDPYLILIAGQLDCLAHQPELWNKCFALVSDLDMAWRVYSGPLVGAHGRSGLPFGGVFRGGGHIIRGLTLDGGSTDNGLPVMSGLFGDVGPSGVIRDLGLEDVSIRGREYEEQVAGMLCAVNGGRIERSYCRGILKGFGRIGGLVGRNTGVIENSYAQGKVADISARDVQGLYAGFVAENVLGAITTCYATCVVASHHGAGLVGHNDAGSVEYGLWDVEASGAEGSDGGIGLSTRDLMDVKVLQDNGWGGNPNWIIDAGRDYPRLIWEGTPGSLIPGPPSKPGGGKRR